MAINCSGGACSRLELESTLPSTHPICLGRTCCTANAKGKKQVATFIRFSRDVEMWASFWSDIGYMWMTVWLYDWPGWAELRRLSEASRLAGPSEIRRACSVILCVAYATDIAGPVRLSRWKSESISLRMSDISHWKTKTQVRDKCGISFIDLCLLGAWPGGLSCA